MVKQASHPLHDALKTEKDPRVIQRILAVHMRLVCNDSVDDIAKRMVKCPRWVSKWVSRYEEGGIDALRDLPRTGRPPAIDGDDMKEFMSQGTVRKKTTPQQVRQMIRDTFGVTHHITHVRRIMHRFGITPKSSQPVHINRATYAAVRSWQWRLKKLISRLRKYGFRPGVFDECFVIHDMKTGRKYWALRGTRINVPYTGSHRKVTAYGTIFFNGDRYVWTEEAKFTDDRFITYMKDLTRKYGKVALFVDRARQHMSKDVREFLKHNKSIRLVYLPKSSPYLNAIEKLWDKVKREVVTGKYYPTFDVMWDALVKCLRTIEFDVMPRKYLYRKAAECGTNF